MFFDAHGDILTDVMEEQRNNVDIWEEYHKEKYEKANVIGSIFVNFSNPNEKSQKNDFDEINKVSVDYFKNNSNIKIIENKEDFQEEKFNLILGIEGLNALEDEKELDYLYEIGYRHIGITWNEKNKFAAGALEEGGLTEKGESLIKKAEKFGMVLDYAHLNEESFYDAAKISNKPIFISHGNPRGMCNHPRNYSDEQLELLKKTNGVIGLASMRFFLNEEKEKATIKDLIEHIKYIKNNFGIDYVGLGFDFCFYLDDKNSKNKVEGLESIESIVKIPELLKEEGFSQEEIDKVCYKNMLRVIKEHLK